MLDKSIFSRRLHRLEGLLFAMFHQLGHYLKDVSCERDYVIASFPVAVCDNIRISNCKLLTGEQWRGYTASMRRYFYGVKVQLLTTKMNSALYLDVSMIARLWNRYHLTSLLKVMFMGIVHTPTMK